MKKNKIIKFFLLIGGGLLLGLVAFMVAEAASSGAVLAKLEKEERMLAAENQSLSVELVRASSLVNFEIYATKMGFIKPQEILYITEKEVFAKLP